MFEPTLLFVLIYLGAIVASIVVGLCLRFLYGKPELRIVVHAIVIILGAVGVFFTIFSWSWIFSLDSNLGHIVPILGFTVLCSLIFGIAVTSGMNRKKEMVAGGMGRFDDRFISKYESK